MNKQLQIKQAVTRCVVEVINPDGLQKRLLGKKKLRIKLGIDPTSPNIHLGRAVVLWKLREFQDLGHQVVFIIGDFTGQIGDTSDKDSERPMLTETIIKTNLKTYLQQAYKILDKSKTEFHYNSKWLKKLGFAEIGQMANLFGLHQFSSRENIAKRLKAGKRVSVRELLYPLMQGYDSVAVKADVELGGIDQKFNLLAGRTIQGFYNQVEQDIVMLDLLEGTDGRKMSSSWGNTINILDPANEMFAKVMSVHDPLIEKYFYFTTRLSELEIKKLLKDISNPRELKLVLAENIVQLYHGQKLAKQAHENFIRQFSNKELPKDIAQITIKPGKYSLVDLLALAKLVESKNEARRLLQQNGVKVNQELPKEDSIVIGQKNNLILQVGKRKFIKIR